MRFWSLSIVLRSFGEISLLGGFAALIVRDTIFNDQSRSSFQAKAHCQGLKKDPTFLCTDDRSRRNFRRNIACSPTSSILSTYCLYLPLECLLQTQLLQESHPPLKALLPMTAPRQLHDHSQGDACVNPSATKSLGINVKNI